MAKLIESRTRIPSDVLTGEDKIEIYSVAARMSWAAERQTTRIEDVAYCLMGIFEVNMPLLYGEGRKAFRRLQEEIVKAMGSSDHSIFAFPRGSMPDRDSDFLSCTPNVFRHSGTVWTIRRYGTSECSITNRGLCMTVRLKEDDSPESGELPGFPGYIAVLDCYVDSLKERCIGIRLFSGLGNENEYIRADDEVDRPSLVFVDQQEVDELPLCTIYLSPSRAYDDM